MVEERSRCARQFAHLCAEFMRRLHRTSRFDTAQDYLAAVERHCADSESWDTLSEFWEFAGSLHMDAGRFDAAQAVFSRARDHHRERGAVLEQTWCEAHAATARLLLGDREGVGEVLARALDTFEQAADTDRYKRTLLLVAKQAQSRAAPEQALRALAEVSEYADEIGDEALRVSCLVGTAEILALIGRFEDGLTNLSEADARHESGAAGFLTAYIRLHAAQIEYHRGRFDAAEDLVEQARLRYEGTGATRVRFAAELLSGQIRLESGRVDEAHERFRRARDLADRVPGEDVPALVAAAFGSVHYERGEYDAAREALTRAAETFRLIGDEYSATLCDQNLAAVAAMTDDAATGVDLIRRACDYYRSHPALRWRLPGAYRVLAFLQRDAGQLNSALWSLSRARALCARFGSVTELAQVDLAVTGLLMPDVPARQRRVRSAVVKRALPATLYLDARRLGFPAASSRIAWRDRISGEHLAVVFDCVHRAGDATSVADLVEATINSGVHTARHVVDDRRFGRLEPIPFAEDPPGPSDPEVTVDCPPLGGAAALIADAVLPMRAPPRLLMPDGRIALHRYWKLADERYGGVERPATVRTW